MKIVKVKKDECKKRRKDMIDVLVIRVTLCSHWIDVPQGVS